MSTEWKSADVKPQIAAGTKLALRMRGSEFGISVVTEVDGFYLHEYGLHYVDGCECFPIDDESDEYQQHSERGCPHTGFYVVRPDEDENFEGIYEAFRCVEWCQR